MNPFLVLLAYLSPALAMMIGAEFAVMLDAGAAAPALGAIVGFLAALVVARIAIAFTPGGEPGPQLISVSNHSTRFVKE